MQLTAEEFAHKSFMDIESGFSFQYSLDEISRKQVLRAMKDFANDHAVRILKELSKTELEYQRNLHLLKDIK